ncbi:MAG: TIGR01777 family oxidoreductase [Microthrixaceae bacterium]
MDVAITGSGGLIGTALSEALRARGDRVLQLTRSSNRAAADEHAAYWSPDDGDIDAAAIEGLDAVIHLAGEPIAAKRWTAQQQRTILTSRTKGTSLIAGTIAGLRTPPKVLLSASAIGYYGDTGDATVDESAPPGSDFLAKVCVEWEGAARVAAEADIRTVTLRTGIVQSTRGGALATQMPFFKFGLGGKVLPGTQWVSWISLTDEVEATLHCLDHDAVSGPVNLVAPNPVTNAEYASTLGSVLHRPTFIIPMIGPKVLYGSELAESLLKTSQRVDNGVLRDTGYHFAHSELRPALEAALADGR